MGYNKPSMTFTSARGYYSNRKCYILIINYDNMINKGTSNNLRSFHKTCDKYLSTVCVCNLLVRVMLQTKRKTLQENDPQNGVRNVCDMSKTQAHTDPALCFCTKMTVLGLGFTLLSRLCCQGFSTVMSNLVLPLTSTVKPDDLGDIYFTDISTVGVGVLNIGLWPMVTSAGFSSNSDSS